MPGASAPGAVGYVVSEYPAISHTFVAREVAALRRRGVRVHTISIRRSDPAKLLSESDRAEFASTFAVLPAPPARIVAAHLRALLTRPRRYLATLRRAIALRPPGLRGLLWQLFYFAEAGIVWAECRRSDVRHLHAHFANVGSDVALLAAHLGGLPWSFTMHGPTEFSDVGLYRLGEKTRDAAFVACISDFARSQLMRLVGVEHWSKLHIVHCGIEPASFEPPAAPPTAGRPRVLCVGRLVADKGQSVLVEAAAILRDRGVPVDVDLVGDGPSRPDLERLVARLGVGAHVRLAGAVGQDEMPLRYQAADVFCLPSFAEGVPVVLMEAMATGLPVVTTAIMGIPELVEDGESGLLVAPGRADLLADALELVVSDRELRESMGRAGQAKVAAEFDITASARRLEALFAGGVPGEPAAAELVEAAGA